MMVDPAVLSTKLYPPPARVNLVPRPHLHQRLDTALNQGHRLLLISVPAGHGKTTLVSDWLDKSGHSFGWLSLDETDNDPARFLAGLSAALHQACDRIRLIASDSLDLAQGSSVQALLMGLVRDIAQASGPVLLVVDDYQVIRSEQVHKVIRYLLQQPLPQFHLALLTREDPPLPVSRLRAQGLLTEIRALDLVFSVDETNILLNQKLELSLSSEQVAALQTRTEGWVTGLHLAGLSLQRRADPGQFIDSFTGSNRYILDYLLEEVLDQQPEAIQSFLYQTSVLERMCAGLCAEVVELGEPPIELSNESRLTRTDIYSAQAILERLEQANLFVIPLDDQRTWYRYHHLFMDFLRSRLLRLYPERVPELHRRAATWHEHHLLDREAVHYALAAQDAEMTTRLIEKAALPLFLRGESATVLSWIQALPAGWEASKPGLSLLYGWALLNDGRLPEAMFRLESIHEAGLNPLFRILLALLRAQLHWFQEHPTQTIEWADRALEACQAPENISVLAPSRFRIPAILFATVMKSEALNLLGQIRAATQSYQQALQAFSENDIDQRWLPLLANVKMKLGRLLYEQNQLSIAEEIIRQGISLAAEGKNMLFLLGGHLILAQVLLAQERSEEALQSVHEAEQMFTEDSHFTDLVYVNALLAHFWSKAGNWETASRYSDHLQQAFTGVAQKSVSSEAFGQQAGCLLAEVLLLQGNPSEAYRLLQPMIAPARAAQQQSNLIQILTLQSLAEQALGKQIQALKTLNEALTLALPEGYMQVFVDKGPAILPMLQYFSKTGASPVAAFTRRLIKAMPKSSGAPARSFESLIEPLSEREMEVLGLLVEGASNPEIAQRLFITIGTVKRHTSNIYGKLGVENRTQAVLRARQLGLL